MERPNTAYEPAPDIAAEKAAARSRVLARRGAIPPDERARRSQALCERLFGQLSELLAPDATVAAYAALGSEVDLGSFVRAACECGWRVALPCMVAVAPRPDAPARPAAGGVRTPDDMVFLEVSREVFDAHEAPFLAKPARALPADDPWLTRARVVAPEQMDAILVPMVAFDETLHRLGYGGGNYDRFLARVRADAFVAGVAFAEQRVDAVPLEPHDLPLPRILVA